MSVPSLLPAPINIQAPLRDLERLWLETSAYYAIFDETAMEDTEWDLMAKELWGRREEPQPPSSLADIESQGLSPYFCHSVGLPWPISNWEGEEGENPIKTAMGVNWEEGLPAIVVEGIRKDGPKRLSMWSARIRALQKAYHSSRPSAAYQAPKTLSGAPRGSQRVSTKKDSK